MKRLNEATKFKDDIEVIAPVVIELNKTHGEKMVRKDRDLIEQ